MDREGRERGTLRILTIGGYGFDAGSFLARLREAGVQLLADVRQRRGMRGARYAFLNSRRLQELLRENGIGYIHLRELAPDGDLRAIQKEEDARLGVAKRSRRGLSPRFASAYRERILERLDRSAMVDRLLATGARRVALFCVEREPAACHRSLAAAWLRHDPRVEDEGGDLLP